MIEIGTARENVVVTAIVIGLFLLLAIDQLTLIQVTRNQVTFKRQINDIIAVQEFILCQEVEILKKYATIEYIMKIGDEYKQIKEESKNDTEQLAIANIIESIYPGITSQYKLSKTSSRNKGSKASN